MQEENNPLICDIETGMCEVPEMETAENAGHEIEKSNEKSIKIIYFTDPICSSCWGIEPQLRKLKLEYGNDIAIEYRMGGLLKDWSYNSGGISKPSDVAHHWDEVSAHYDMPINGDLWLEDPLSSSYPPSVAFKAAQLQDEEKALLFLREIKEMVFLQKKNITKWENLEAAAKKAGLNIEQFKNDFEEKAQHLFEEDLNLARKMGVRGFPTLFFSNQAGETEIMYGVKSYNNYEEVIKKIAPAVEKFNYDKEWTSIFTKYNSLTALEFSELSGIPRNEVNQFLNDLTDKGNLKKFTTKNGIMWTLKNTAK